MANQGRTATKVLPMVQSTSLVFRPFQPYVGASSSAARDALVSYIYPIFTKVSTAFL